MRAWGRSSGTVMIGRIASFCFLAIAILCTSAAAQGREALGYGRIIVNDLFGDGRDRWRTGSISTSRVLGFGWNGRLPEHFGEIIEIRYGAEIISPQKLNSAGSGDRPFAGAMSWGLHTHFRLKNTEFSVGGELVAIGPMTQLDEVQKLLHELLGIPSASNTVLAAQLSNQWSARAVAEVGRNFYLGNRSRLRPFAEARAGDENLLRTGFDFTFGTFGQGELLIRDWVTGHRYRAIKNQQPGLSFVLGADVAKVFDSVYLPSSRGLTLTNARNRVRAGLHWQRKKSHFFYGLTWLDKEFVGQNQSQVVGAIRLDVKF